MTQLEQLDAWSSVVRLAHELPLAVLAERFSTSPGTIAAAWVRTGPHDVELGASDDLPPEAGDALEVPVAVPATPKAQVPKKTARSAAGGVAAAWSVRWTEGDHTLSAVVLAASLQEAVEKAAEWGPLVGVQRVEGRVEYAPPASGTTRRS